MILFVTYYPLTSLTYSQPMRSLVLPGMNSLATGRNGHLQDLVGRTVGETCPKKWPPFQVFEKYHVDLSEMELQVHGSI